MSVIELTSATFEATVLQSSQPFLVDFWADWCPPCKVVGPLVAEIADEYQGVLQVGKLDVDEHVDVAMAYGIASIPTLMLFVGGQVADIIIGAVPKEEILDQLSPFLTV